MSTRNRRILIIFWISFVLCLAFIFLFVMSISDNPKAFCEKEYYNCEVMFPLTLVLWVIFGLCALVAIVKLKMIQNTPHQLSKSQGKEGKS